MINLDQVRTLEWKVKQAVQLITHLRRENDALRGRLSDTEVRLQELESLLEAFKATQTEMESGIRSALEELDHLEGADAIPAEASAPSEPVVPVETFVLPSHSEPEAAVEAEEPSFDSTESAAIEEAFYDEAPDSVELEEKLEDQTAADPVQEEREPEQPGLGIF